MLPLKPVPMLLQALRRASWLAALAALLAAAPARAEPAAMRVTEAEFSAIATNGEVGPPSAVPLPDTWVQRGLNNGGSARYRLSFALTEVPTQPWAVSFTRVSASRRVFLNDALVQDQSQAGRQYPGPDVVELPALRLGINHVDMELRYRARGGLSQAQIGPSAVLRAQAERNALWQRELPRALNVGMAMVAALMLLIRWRRPGETTIALFGALALLGSLRNYAYFANTTLLPPALSDWLYFCAQIWTAALFVAFARSLGAARERRWVPRLLLGVAVVVPAAAALAMPLGLLPALRTFTYPLLLVFGAIAVQLLWRAGRHHGVRANATLAAMFGLVVAAGVHDYLYQQGRLSVTGGFWMPYVMPIALGLYASLLLSRFVDAIAEVEALRDNLEAQVAQRTQALELAVASKTRFLAAASHDLRQPAVAIGLMIGLVRERALASDVRHMVDRAHQAVGALETLLQGLLDLSRLESGTVQPRPVVLPLRTLFEAIHSHEAEMAVSKGLRLRFRAHDLAVRCDAQLLDQLLRNLVGNALRYTERGGVLVVARARGPDQVLIQVWDTGIGIAPQHQAQVFGEFMQIERRDGAGGLGLGLALVERCAALLGTRVQLRSTPGRGSCFGVLLPRLERRQVARACPALPATAPLAGRRFVVVDDDTAVREALSARLQAWGANVSAFDGLPGLREWLRDGLRAGHAAPDMLLTDHQIGAGSGLEVIEAVRRQHGVVPALLVTGNTAPAQIAQLARSGVPLLHKPFRAEALLAAIENALAGDRNPRALHDEQARTVGEADRAGADAFSAR